MTTGKTIALTRQTFVGKVMSLLLNMLSRLVITFLPRSKRLLISWLHTWVYITKNHHSKWHMHDSVHCSGTSGCQDTDPSRARRSAAALWTGPITTTWPPELSSVQFSRSVVSLIAARQASLFCPSPAPGVHSHSRPSSRWCHPKLRAPPIHKACGAANGVALRKGPVVGIAKINSKHNRLMRSQLKQANFPSSFKGKKKEKTKNQTATRQDAQIP